MLKNLADKTTQDIYDGINSRRARKLPRELHDKARRLLAQINVTGISGMPWIRTDRCHR